MFEKPELIRKLLKFNFSSLETAIDTSKKQFWNHQVPAFRKIMRPLKYKKIFGGTYIKWSCSPDTEGRCFCRSCRPRCSSGRGMTLSSSRGSRGMWWGRGCWAAERPGLGDRGWWRRTAPSPSWWGGSGLLASSRTLDCVLTELRVMFWSRIWCRLTRVLWEQPGPG